MYVVYVCIKDGDVGGRATERKEMLELERHVLEVETCFSNTNLTRHDGNLLGSFTLQASHTHPASLVPV